MANLVKDLLKKAKEDLESSRKQEVSDRLDIYRDSWETILNNELNAQFHEKTRGNIKQMLALDSNVLKRVVKEISVVYQESAVRSYTLGEGEQAKEDETYQELLSKIPINIIMQETNRLTNLCNESLIYIVPRGEKIDYDIITPDIVEVSQSQTKATDVEAIVFTQTFVDTLGDTTIFYIYYDIFGRHLKFDEDFNPVKIEGNEKGINPYKDPNNPGQTILPFVIFHKDYPINAVWNTTGGGDLVNGTKQVGVLLTYLNYLIKMASFKQRYFKGIPLDDVPMTLVHDPAFTLVVSNPEGDVGVLDFQVALKEIWELIYSKIGAIANNYGMSLDNFRLTGDAQSGYALRIKNRGLEKIVEEQIKLYRWHERELFEKTKIINNTAYPKKKIADNGDFKIDFVEQEYPEAPEEERQQWKFDISMGAKSIADYAMSVNPDLKTQDEAIEYIKSNDEINKTIEAETGISVATLLEKAFKEEEEPALVP